MVFAIDCDEVLRMTLSSMLKIYNEEFDDSKKMEDVKSFNVAESFPKIQEETGIDPAEWFFDIHGHEIFFNSKVFRGAKKSIDTLKKYGKVVILSHQHSLENKLDTLNWLCKNKLATDDICFLKDKYLMKCDYLIDDNPDNFRKSGANHFVLITAPYNKHVENWRDTINDEDLIRYDSLEKFVETFVKEHPIVNYDSSLDCKFRGRE